MSDVVDQLRILLLISMVIGFTITSPLVLTANATTTIEADSTDDSELAVADASFAQTTQNVTVPVNGTTSNGTNVTQPVRYVNSDELEAQDIRPQASLSSAGIQLARSLGVRLTVSADELAEQNYEAASETLGAAYRSDVVRLTDIAEATENTSDDQLAAAFREAQINQRAAIETGTEYRQLYQQYQQARANQNETEARQIARRLSDRFTELNNTATNLTAVSETIASLNESRAQQIQQRINTTLQRVESITKNAQESTYIDTAITANTTRTRTSPSQPLIITGQLQSANSSKNETTLTNRTIALETPRGTVQTTTNASGRFRITYTPIRLTLGDTNLTVQYVPQGSAGYLGSSDTVQTQVVSRRPAFDKLSFPETLSNGTQNKITARITIENKSYSGIPIIASVNNKTVGQGRTNMSGYVSIPIQLPLSTPEGLIEVTVQAGRSNMAVAVRQLSRPITVRPVQVNLDVTGSPIDNRTFRIGGRLTRDGAGLINYQSVTVLADDRVIALLRTNSNGIFKSNLTLTKTHPALADTRRVVNLTVRFRSPSTHLSTATTTTSVILNATSVTGNSYTGLLRYGVKPTTWTLASGIVAIGITATAILFHRRNNHDDEPSQENRIDLDEISTDDNTRTGTDGVEISAHTLSALYTEAQSATVSDPERATRLGYFAVRQHFSNTIKLSDDSAQDSLTHWEFYNHICTYTDENDNDTVNITALTTHGNTLSAFEKLTQLYEQAVYTTKPINPDTTATTLASFKLNFTTETDQDINTASDTLDE